MRSYPYTIENGAGEKLTFARRVVNGRGDRLEGENLVAPGSGPPMHVHYQQDEALTVVSGKLGYQVAGQPPVFAEAGETVLFRAGQAHRFWNAGETPLQCTAYIEPAGNVEYFLESIFTSQKENGGQRPSIFDAAFLTRKYRSEFGMMEIPAPVQRVVFPAVIALGRLLGKYRKYADAPEPFARKAAARERTPAAVQKRSQPEQLSGATVSPADM